MSVITKSPMQNGHTSVNIFNRWSIVGRLIENRFGIRRKIAVSIS